MNTKNLEHLLSVAFDEGSESPYDLKEDIVTSLMKTEEKIITSPNIPLVEAYLDKKLWSLGLSELTNELKFPDIWIAGGFPLYLMIFPIFFP